MNRFHSLTVTHVHKTIRDAIVLTLQPESEELFEFTQGQYLTFRQDFGGTELRRSYSICSAPHENRLRVGIKRVDGGAFSNWANENIRVGDTLEAMPPMGQFHTALDASSSRHYLAFAGGSGITPILSILKTTLEAEPRSRLTLVYANRQVNTIMFRNELEDLKNRYMDRLNILHILEHEAQDIELFTGRVTQEKCADLFRHWIDVSQVDLAFICGPEPMMLGIAAALRDRGLSDDQIKFELFASGQPGRLPKRARASNATARGATLSITLDGTTRDVVLDPETSVLQAALANQIDAPYACTAGVCSTCRCKLLKGQVEMATNHALEDDEVAKGYILSCQSYALSDTLVVDYDQ